MNTIHQWETETPSEDQIEEAQRELAEALFQMIWPAIKADWEGAKKHPASKFLKLDDD